MTAYYADDQVTLYHGDATEILDVLATGVNQTGRFNAMPKGHKGDHICAYQDDDQDDCRWRNWDEVADTPQP